MLRHPSHIFLDMLNFVAFQMDGSFKGNTRTSAIHKFHWNRRDLLLFLCLEKALRSAKKVTQIDDGWLMFSGRLLFILHHKNKKIQPMINISYMLLLFCDCECPCVRMLVKDFIFPKEGRRHGQLTKCNSNRCSNKSLQLKSAFTQLLDVDAMKLRVQVGWSHARDSWQLQNSTWIEEIPWLNQTAALPIN